MGIFDRLFGAKQQSGALAKGGGNYSIDGNVAQVGNGVGQVIEPSDRDTVGIYVDGGFIKAAEANGLAIEPWMVSEAKQAEQDFKQYRKNMHDYCKAVRSVSKDSAEMVDVFYKTKAEVSANHVRQHQSHNRYLTQADRNAAAMNYEQKKRNKDAQRIQEKLQQWESKQLEAAKAV